MEPWYQTQEITSAEVKTIMEQTWFHKELHSETNSTLADEMLIVINPLFTFAALRRVPQWKEIARRVLQTEMAKESSFGSHRGFYTFCYKPLETAYINGVVRECWATIVMTKFMRCYIDNWIEQRYAPDGAGYEAAKTHFQHAAKIEIE